MPDVKMDYQQMEEMARAFDKAGQDVEASMNAIKGQAAKLQDAFQGEGGSEMQDAIAKVLLKKMELMRDKMKEVSGDLKTAIEATKEGITTSKSPYSG